MLNNKSVGDSTSTSQSSTGSATAETSTSAQTVTSSEGNFSNYNVIETFKKGASSTKMATSTLRKKYIVIYSEKEKISLST